MQIYDSYDDEPEDIFFPLTDELNCRLYAAEMTGFAEDLDFYRGNLPAAGHILEVACGTARVGGILAAEGYRVTGIDLSLPMLRQARQDHGNTLGLAVMDMRQLAFRSLFDAVLIPYNSLNLLADPIDIHACLSGCRDTLKDGGRLLLHLFVPGRQLLQQPGQNVFQFRMFDDPQLGRIIRETLRVYHPELQTLELEERFRLRPVGGPREDFSQHRKLCAWPAERWLETLADSGFAIDSCHGSFTLATFISGRDSTLLVAARRR
jgi:SAM-dependent methyltransferase